MSPIRTATLISLCTGLLCLPGPTATLVAAPATTLIKVSTMAPRTPQSVLRAKKFNKKLAIATEGRVKFRTYYGGTMGDDRTVLRKIRAGQIDASPFGVDLVSNFVRQAAVLAAPRTFRNYAQIDAVRKEITPDFDEEAFRNGYKVLSWWDFGKIRMFSAERVATIADLKRVRPWLYPHSPILRQFYKNNGVTGVPLGIGEVYPGLQTGMIDTVWISAVGALALRWHTKTKYMSEPLGFIQGAFVLSRKTWERLSPEDQTRMMAMIRDNQGEFQADIRRTDKKSYKKLLTRGMSLQKFERVDEWQAAGKALREQLIGRIYDRALLTRVEKIAARYADQPSELWD